MTSGRFFPSGTYDLFLTHAWYYTDEWQGLVALLDDQIPGKWRNWSLPWHDTSIDRSSTAGRKQLEQLLDGQISMTSVLLLIPETARTNDGKAWLDRQLSIASHHRKPVVGVLPMAGGNFPEHLTPRASQVVPRDAAEILRVVDQLSLQG